MATVPDNSANEDGESSDSGKYITLCAECESIAVQIHPSYEKQYVGVADMTSKHPFRPGGDPFTFCRAESVNVSHIDNHSNLLSEMNPA